MAFVVMAFVVISVVMSPILPERAQLNCLLCRRFCGVSNAIQKNIKQKVMGRVVRYVLVCTVRYRMYRMYLKATGQASSTCR